MENEKKQLKQNLEILMEELENGLQLSQQVALALNSSRSHQEEVHHLSAEGARLQQELTNS